MTHEPPSLRGTVALVTGAARGLGAGLARELSRRGAAVALVGLEDDAIAAQAAACGPDAAAFVADVTDGARMTDVADDVRRRFGRIDAVVANAGIATGGTLRRSRAEAFDRVIEVNLLGQVRTARAVLPHLFSSRGYYLQVTSAAALLPAPALAAYCASKAGAESFAHALGGEVRHLGVGVGVAYLSWVDTDLVRATDAYPSMRAARAAMPWPANRTYRVDDAVRALADGVAYRRAHVMFPRWLWAAYAGRALTPTVLARIGGRFARGDEAAAVAHSDTQVGLIGPGGAADEAARRQRSS